LISNSLLKILLKTAAKVHPFFILAKSRSPPETSFAKKLTFHYITHIAKHKVMQNPKVIFNIIF
jgi:hypothetical protein